VPAAAEASLDFLLRFQIRKPITPATMAMTATPPTTPPAMAPAFEPPPSLSFSSACEEVRALGSGVPEEAGTAWTEVVVERVPSELVTVMVTSRVEEGPVESGVVDVFGGGIVELSLVVVLVSLDRVVGEVSDRVVDRDEVAVWLGVSVTVQSDWQLNMVSGD